jgi:21S rRNA (uridine2791-2'-O)-methyltransferase
VVGIDLIPAQPPRGVSTIQGNFLSPAVRNLVKTFVAEGAARRQIQQQSRDSGPDEDPAVAKDVTSNELARDDAGNDAVVIVEQTSYIDAERIAARDALLTSDEAVQAGHTEDMKKAHQERLVDVSLLRHDYRRL